MTRAWLLVFAIAACGGDDGPEVCNLDGPMCKKLSSWELFDDVAAQQPAAGVIPYDLNTPLFSDYATKHRFVRVPDGTPAHWSAEDALDLPVGSVLVKTFSYLHDRRDPGAGERMIETRVLVHGETGWHGGSYVYGDATDDAELAIAGALVDTSWIHDDGSERSNHYVVPNQNQCKLCHAEHDDVMTPIGPKARHVQPDRLQALVDAGALVDAPPRAEWPAAIDAFDASTGTLEQRARAWLDINCGYCHNPRGAARTSGLYLDHMQTDPAKFGVCKAPVATGRGSGGFQYDIVPGDPDQSIIMYRISSTEPEIRMPELGRNLVHEEGVALIREWITSMTGGCTSVAAHPGAETSHSGSR